MKAEQLRIPGSIGELFDKITILEIKFDRIADPHKLQNVNHELTLLRALEAEAIAPDEEQMRLVAELKRINESLWDIEDALRDCERRQDFGADFISLARSVYMTNDRRAGVKKELNLRSGSSIVEEKSYACKSARPAVAKCAAPSTPPHARTNCSLGEEPRFESATASTTHSTLAP